MIEVFDVMVNPERIFLITFTEGYAIPILKLKKFFVYKYKSK